MPYLELDDVLLTERGAAWTAREIEQQPRSWERTQRIVSARAPEIDAFLRPLLARDDLRVILTGAGSSAYIGDCVAPSLLRSLNRRVEAIATTDLISGPQEYFQRNVPTLLVSFGRSGNSPESVAAVDLARKHVAECYQLVITCNAQGELYTACEGRADSLAILLPEETHDRSFAMTSSFSCMLYAVLAIFEHMSSVRASAAGSAVLSQLHALLRELATRPYTRVVYLGSKGLSGLASEAALKLLELTDGQVVAIPQSSLGLRHGPKTFINRETLVVMFLSNDPLTRRYDLDLLRELRRDSVAGRVLAITAQRDTGGEDLFVPGLETAADTELMLPYVVCAQLYAFHRALGLNNSPDSPNAAGTVSRVVQGVTIHTA